MDPTEEFYDKLYPKVPITPEALRELEGQVIQRPGGEKFIDDMLANLTRFRMRQDLLPS
jgi:hypothetical protein